MGRPVEYSVAAGERADIQGPIHALRIIDFADDCQIRLNRSGETQHVTAFRTYTPSGREPFFSVRIFGGASQGMTVEVLHEPGEFQGTAQRKAARFSAGWNHKQYLLNDNAANASEAVFPAGIQDSWVGGKIHIVVQDAAHARQLRKWLLLSSVGDPTGASGGNTWYPAGDTDPTQPGIDQTIELPIDVSCLGFYLQVIDGLGNCPAVVFVEVPQ